MNYDKAHALAAEIRAAEPNPFWLLLAAEIRASEEFKRYKAAKERIEPGSSSEAFLSEYKKLQLKAQADMVAGQTDEETLSKLQRLGELLQMDRDAAEYLFAEFALSRLVGDIYRIVANAAELDISMLD